MARTVRTWRVGRDTPPIHFDGRIYWYTAWVDPTDDRCSLCRGPIDEHEVPLSLFKDVSAHETWQARFCETCTPMVLSQLTPPRRGDG